MKHYLLTLLTFLGVFELQAQCNTPPPPGYNPVYSVDLDNDGYTTFDIGYYILNEDRPAMEQIHNVSSSGYNFVFYNSLNTVSELTYTNITLEEFCSVHYEYTGTGPTFDPQPPCYWPVPTQGNIKLVAVAFDGDQDADGILNTDEDTNHNLNLMDDDDDNDGIINLEDSTFTLASNSQTIAKVNVYPNPVTNGILYIESSDTISTVAVYDVAGQLVLLATAPSKSLRVDRLARGVYFVKCQAGKSSVVTKIVIQ